MKNPAGTSGETEIASSVWTTECDILALRANSGELFTPTALDILKAEFKGQRHIGNYLVANAPGQEVHDLKINRFPLSLRLVLQAPSESNRFQGRWWAQSEVRGEKKRLDQADLLRGHLFASGEWFALNPDDLEEIGACQCECALSIDGKLSLGSYLKLIVRRNSAFIHSRFSPENAEDLPSESEVEGTGIDLNATLYPYQQSGVSWLTGIAKEALGGILGDEMGLGKTLQIIALFASEIQQGRKQHLVVAPVTLLENWRREILKFAPRITPLVHQGKDRTGFPKNLKSADVVITSYDTVIRDTAMFQMINWGVVVLDEAQAIKNPSAQRTRAVKNLHRRVGIAVTGTPVENRLLDLWSLMDFAVTGHLGTQSEFVSRFVDSVDDAAALEPLVSPLLLRRRVANVARDLPPRIDIPQIISLSVDEAELYEKIRLRTIDEFGKAAALVNLTRLRMFCAHPRLSEDGRDYPVFESTKLTRLLEILEEVFDQGEKALVFTSYTEMADLISGTIRVHFGVQAETLDGRRAIEDRQPLIDRFGNTKDIKCLVLNPKAAGAGLNITAANHVIHYNPEWNPATEDQASARSYRRGQTKPVTVHQLIFGGTVEEVILDRLGRKRLLAETAVVGGTGDTLDHGDIVRALTLSPLRKDPPTS